MPRAIERVVADDLGADEAARDVAVDLAGRELGRRAARNRPGAALVFADGEERNVAEQIVAGANDAIETRFGEAEIGEKRRRASAGFELRDLELDLRADRDGRGAPRATETASARPPRPRSSTRVARRRPPAAALRRG